MKFSLIIPVYNLEKYIEKCIDSILKQTYKNYEIIVINDGSTDNSKKILEKYKDIKLINKKNQGLSAARNKGIEVSSGDYILFIDGDDYIEKDLLKILNDNIVDEDLIRFQTRTVDEDYNIIKEYYEEEIESTNIDNALEKILKYHFIECSCLYCYKKELINKFKFDEGYIHEDFGLTPRILNKTNKFKSINYIGYNYLTRTNSIMTNRDNKKTIKKCNDMFELGLRNIKEIEKSNLSNKNLLISYIANSILLKGRELKQIDRKEFLKRIKENKIDNYILTNTIKRKIKKILFKINYNLFLKVM